MQTDESRYDRGLAKMREMFGPGIDFTLKSLAATSPDLVRCLVESRSAKSTHAPVWT